MTETTLRDNTDRSLQDKRIKRTALDDAFAAIVPALKWALAFSVLMSTMAFGGALYALNVYDRVLGSRNLTTLAVLTVMLIVTLFAYAAMMAIRASMLRRASVAFDRLLSPAVFIATQQGIVRQPGDHTLAGLPEAATLRDFWNSPAFMAALDIPGMLFFFIIGATLIHPAFGLLILIAGGLIGSLTLATARADGETSREARKARSLASRRALSTFRNAETVQAMGMAPALQKVWRELHELSLSWTVVGEERSARFSVPARFLKDFMQSAALCLGVFLVIHGDMSAGLMFASTIIIGKALAPLLQLIVNWSAFGAVRLAWERLQDLLLEAPDDHAKMTLPRPTGVLSVDSVAIGAPGQGLDQLILRGIAFDMPAGSILAIVGPSGSGKSTLLKAMVNVWKPALGKIRYDGAALEDWNPIQFGNAIGYLPQEVDLFPGTIEQNISRFTDASHEQVIAAAKSAGAHDMILSLPDGYNRELGELGGGLSGGQRQRVGLARALFGAPSILFLDEPNSSLDAIGEERLLAMLVAQRDAGCSVVFVTHKISHVSIADRVLVLRNGGMADFGVREEVLRRLSQPRVVPLRGEARHG